jgi:hypothetical protein
VRSSAAEALGKIGGAPEVVSGLLTALRDENVGVRSSAAWALGEMKVDTAEVVSGLLTALRDEKEVVRSSAAEALGEVKVDTAGVVSRLLTALRDEKGDVRSSAAEALGKIGGAPEVVSGLLTALRDENEDVRGLAAWALGESPKDRKSKLPQELSRQVTDTLRDMLDDPRNQESELFIFVGGFVGGRFFIKPIDAIWEALWLMCRQMDE